jgi:hypothetical protein
VKPSGHASLHTALALTGLAAVTLVYTWPLLSRLTTAMPGGPSDLDVVTMVWNVDWMRRVIEQGAPLWYTDRVLIPFGADLRLHALAPLQGVVAYPLTKAIGTLGAYNLILILSLFLNAAAFWWLARRETRHSGAALAAAVCFMFCLPVVTQFRVGRPSFASMWIVCFALVALASLLDRPRAWTGLALGGCLLAAVFTDFQVMLFSVLWLTIYASYRLWQDRMAILTWAHLRQFGVAALVVLGPFAAIFYPALAGAARAGYPTPTAENALAFSFRIQHYLIPGGVRAAGGYELFASAVIAVLVFRGRGRSRIWLAGALVFLVLTLGPYDPPTGIPLPFAALTAAWPPLAQFRTPGRFTTPASLGLAMVAAHLFSAWLSRVRSAALVALMVGVVLVARLVGALAVDPYQVQIYPTYAAYEAIAREPGDFAVLEVPFGVRSGLEQVGTAGGERLLYYQLVHGKRVPNAMIARLPSPLFAAYRAHPALVFLSGTSGQSAARELEADLATFLREIGARYVLVHRARLAPDHRSSVEAFLDAHPNLDRRQVEDDLVVYRWRES